MKISANWLRKPSTQSIMEILISDGHEAYFVGGCLRDTLFNLKTTDVDIATSAHPKKVLEITNGKGVPVVYDGVGKDTLDGSIECLAVRGMMVSFGNASGPLSDINVPKVIQPKGLYLVRPSMQQYLSTREELDEASKTMFEKISSGKVKIKIFKKYKLDEIVQAHKDLEGRKILGPAVIVPN